MKEAVELAESLRYILRIMMGVDVQGPTNVFCDKEAVVCNTSRPESTFKRKKRKKNGDTYFDLRN